VISVKSGQICDVHLHVAISAAADEYAVQVTCVACEAVMFSFF